MSRRAVAPWQPGTELIKVPEPVAQEEQILGAYRLQSPAHGVRVAVGIGENKDLHGITSRIFACSIAEKPCRFKCFPL